MIVTGEILHATISSHVLPDYSALTAYWGKIGEVALRQCFLTPLAAYLNRNAVTGQVKIRPFQKSRFTVNEWLVYRGDWQEMLPGVKFYKIDGLLFAAALDDQHMIHKFFNQYKIDNATWTGKLPYLIAELRELRNEAAHDLNGTTRASADQARAVLVTKGLLSEIGTAFWKVSRRS